MAKKSKALVVRGNVEDEFNSLAEEIASGFTEHIHIAREEVITAHHEAGRLMGEFLSKHEEMSARALIQRLERMGSAKETTLYLSLKCFERWPKYDDMIDEIGQGKNTSWNKVRRALAAPKVKEELPECNHQCPRHCKV